MAAVFQMITSRVRRGSKLRIPKPAGSPRDLAKRFLELKRLRQQVDEFERLAAMEGQQSAARTGEARHRK
jgi:hypothetical protein